MTERPQPQIVADVRNIGEGGAVQDAANYLLTRYAQGRERSTPTLSPQPPEESFPGRVRIGDGPWVPCRLVAFDLAADSAPPVSGYRDADGTFHRDRVGVPASQSPYDAFSHLRFEFEGPVFPSGQTFAERMAAIVDAHAMTMADLAEAVAGERRFVDAQTLGAIPVGEPRTLNTGGVAGYFSRLRPASHFAVDVTAPPNSCARCGTEQRGHGGGHAYTPPDNVLRLARMKARREARLNPAPVRAASPDLFAAFTVDTARLAEAFQRLGESVARAVEPMAAQIHAAALALGAASSGVHWPAEAAVCCHVCGPDPGHVCDARATTSITHPLPSGGTRTLPLCAPCRAAENAAITGA